MVKSTRRVRDRDASREREAAGAVIPGQARWVLTREQGQAFVRHLLNAPEPNEALKAAVELFRVRSGEKGRRGDAE